MFRPQIEQEHRETQEEIQKVVSFLEQQDEIREIYKRLIGTGETDAHILLAAMFIVLPHLKENITLWKTGRLSDCNENCDGSCGDRMAQISQVLGSVEAIKQAASEVVSDLSTTVISLSTLVSASESKGGRVINLIEEEEEEENAVLGSS